MGRLSRILFIVLFVPFLFTGHSVDARPSSGLQKALGLVRQKNYPEASRILYILSVSKSHRHNRSQIKYLLGLMLYQMGLYQTSAFHFVDVIQSGKKKYIRKSLEKLSLAASAIQDDTVLNYALSKINIKNFPKEHRFMLYYRIGEIQLRKKRYEDAIRSFKKVSSRSLWFGRAKYSQGLAHSLLRQNRNAIIAFKQLINARRGRSDVDQVKIAAHLGLARAYYQNKQWTRAIDEYRQVPRDASEWHNTLFESSWAMLRAGRFRGAISNFQTIHSPYYKDYYLPESFLLRSIVYLYLCRYQEMEKTLSILNKTYRPVRKKIQRYLARTKSSKTYFNDIFRYYLDFNKNGHLVDQSLHELPILVSRKIIKQARFQRSLQYIENISEEKSKLNQLPLRWRRSGLGKHSYRVLNRRLVNARRKAGSQVKKYLRGMRKEIDSIFEQESLVRYELIRLQKKVIKKRISGAPIQAVDLKGSQSRSFYVANGYEYWPFQGEYWLDELGNYHYTGTESCRK